jgi:hypothetical protein
MQRCSAQWILRDLALSSAALALAVRRLGSIFSAQRCQPGRHGVGCPAKFPIAD